MGKIILSVAPHSVAEKHGIRKGDEILAVSGRIDFDIIDFLTETSEESYTLTVRHNQKEKSFKIKNPDWEPSGISFETLTADEPRKCHNNCIFCFMDQMPQGLRETLYFKDDDYRLSFLCGNYITLTNVSEEEIRRIIQFGLSPMNISVHATDPNLRVSMLRNKHAGELLSQLQQLKKGDIELNLQLVLCPGINDREMLQQTLDDILTLLPAVQSVSCVPVGLTKYRDNLYPLRLFDQSEACNVLAIIDEYRKKAKALCGSEIICASDEFFILAKQSFPPDAYYGDYIQYENGVGMCRSFIDEIDDSLSDETFTIPPMNATLVTGTLAFPVIQSASQKIMQKHPQCRLNVIPIKNGFFGNTITVAGLVCGSDIIEQIGNKTHAENLIIPSTMLKDDEPLFLDNTSLSEISKQLGVHCIVSPHYGAGLMETLQNWRARYE